MTVCLETPVIYCADEKVCEKLPKTIVYEFGNLLCRGCHYLVYYESIKRELKIKPIYECRCDERLKTKVEESTRLTYTGLIGELEHLKIKTRLIDEKFASVMGEYVFLK
jgi:hypothetical protein